MIVENSGPSAPPPPGTYDGIVLHHDAVDDLPDEQLASLISRINPNGVFISPPEISRIKPLLQESGFQIFEDREALRAVRQNTAVRPMLLHCSIPEEQAASSDIRIHYPNAFLRTVPGVRPYAQVGVLNFGVAREDEARILIFHRSAPKIDRDLEMLRRAMSEGYILVYEMDDHPAFSPEHYADHNFALRCYHAMQTTNGDLAALFRPAFGDDIGVFPNQLAFLPSPPASPKQETTRIFFGAFNRSAEGRAILTAINPLLPDFGDKAHFEVVHDQTFFDGLETAHKTFTPRCSYGRYQEILASTDIALLPLEDTAFNRCKSDLKFLECAGHGAAVICSPTVYRHSVTDGQTGLIADELSDFGDALRDLTQDRDRRLGLQTNAYAYVRDNRMLAQHYNKRITWYRSLWEQRERLREGLKQRAPELFA